MPSPLRKSGMPDSVLTPAPVKATAQRAPARRAARRATPSSQPAAALGFMGFVAYRTESSARKAQASAGGSHGQRGRPVLAQPRLHVAPEEDLLGRARHDAQHENGAEEVGARRAFEHAANELQRATRVDAEQHGERVERLPQREQPNDG